MSDFLHDEVCVDCLWQFYQSAKVSIIILTRGKVVWGIAILAYVLPLSGVRSNHSAVFSHMIYEVCN